MFVQVRDHVGDDLEYDEDAHQRIGGLGQDHESGPHDDARHHDEDTPVRRDHELLRVLLQQQKLLFADEVGHE